MKKIEKYIPLDKSWTIRMGILDLINGYSDTLNFMTKQDTLSDDLVALKRVCKIWEDKESVDVGESGTLYRFLQFVSWKYNLNKRFVKHGTLKSRKICNNPAIVDYSLKELLRLDNNTSQWASAAVLCGDEERLPSPPYKLKITHEAVNHWKERRAKGDSWNPRFDKTISKQADAFLTIVKSGKTKFVPKQSEDYCFARAFGFMDASKGESLWPSLKGHESNRIIEMEKTLLEYEKGNEISSKDHRVVQAITMKAKVDGQRIKVKYPDSVNKTWPQFWDFIENAVR